MESTTALILLRMVTAWKTLLDIALLAAGLFFLYRTILRLGTWKIVAGIGVALGVYLGATVLDLKGVEWVFGNLSHVAVIALIVIFQPELRKIFERAASMRRSESGIPRGGLLHILTDAADKLSQARHGAIIVLPGKEPLGEWISGGFALDAKPSLALVLSIFDPHSPGHDGALIVIKGRFARYGVRLPVSQSARLGSDFGTRHHAAMGLAEKTDALVIVVSEERGAVSLFKKGEKRSVATEREMAKALVAHWKEAAASSLELPEGPKRRAVVFQIVASIALAVIFWSTLIISQGEILEKIITVPVEYAASPPQLVLVGDKQQEIRVHLTGQKSDLDTVSPTHTTVKIDLSKAVPGKQTFVINEDSMRLPRGVNLLDVSPSAVTLTLAEIVERQLPVKPQLVGKLPPGLVITAVTVVPEQIAVFSPAIEGKGKIAGITTTPIYLESVKETTIIFCKIIAPPSVQPIDKRWPDVEVRIEIAPAETPEKKK
ncbi:MAG: diadenylate cyclase [Pseudomonadota bacterium]